MITLAKCICGNYPQIKTSFEKKVINGVLKMKVYKYLICNECKSKTENVSIDNENCNVLLESKWNRIIRMQRNISKHFT